MTHKGFRLLSIRRACGYWRRFAAIVIACCFADAQVWAASAWAYESGTGIVGKGVASTVNKAKQKARTDCENNGANPSLVNDLSSTFTPGYGAVYISDNGAGGLKIGASLGYNKKKKAKKRAKEFCQISGGTNCQLIDTVHDPGKNGVKRGNKRRTGRAVSLGE
ncbi:MAG: DUF4189 domain-containing protein [Candidatus Hydrogenedentes bacterium]|nr:DUF4189 domain-containing protein [Candidatus Hydrogenedentota bacterium]